MALSTVELRGPCEASGTLVLLPAPDPGSRGGADTLNYVKMFLLVTDLKSRHVCKS